MLPLELLHIPLVIPQDVLHVLAIERVAGQLREFLHFLLVFVTSECSALASLFVQMECHTTGIRLGRSNRLNIATLGKDHSVT